MVPLIGGGGSGVDVGGEFRGSGASEKIPSSTAAGLGFRQIGGIGVDMEHHITGMVGEGCIGVGGCIIKELGEGLGRGMGGTG
jgi:hypothetical protein